MFEVQYDVPIEAISSRAPGRRRKYPFESMKVGGFFFYPNKARNTLGSHVWDAKKRTGFDFKTKLCWMIRNEDGKWRPATAQEPGAVQGVGVWRIA